MTLRTRDDVDVADAHVAFHLSAGVDVVIANDHRSGDGTRELLERYERSGRLVLVRRDEERYTPGTWVNEMARMAAAELGADWVFHCDADEFWWPRGGDIKEVLSAVPSRFGVVRGVWRHFAPRPADGSHFAERLVARLASRGPWAGVEHTFHPNVKVAHRADASASVRPGNHDVETTRPLLRSWYPIEVLHFPLRTRAQAEARARAWKPVLEAGHPIATHVDAAVEAVKSSDFTTHYSRYVVDDERLAAGLRDGVLTLDTRLRDALRTLAGDPLRPLSPSPQFAPQGAGNQIHFPSFGLVEEASLADDAMSLGDAIDRAGARVDALERRIAALERPRIKRAGAGLRARFPRHGRR